MSNKNLYKEIFNSFNNFLKESRLNTLAPEDITGDEFNLSAVKQKNDRTRLSLEEQVKEITDYVMNNEDIFVSYVSRYKFNSNPEFEVNPNIEFSSTPHGIYGYPLTKDNLYRFFVDGKPTSADFASDRPYYHIYKLDGFKKIKIASDGSTNYDERKYYSDLNELTRNFVYMLVSYFSGAEGKKLLNDLEDLGIALELSKEEIYQKYIIEKHKSFVESNIAFYVFQLFYNDVINIYERIDDDIIISISSFIAKDFNNHKKSFNKSKFYVLYYAAKKFSAIVNDIEKILRSKKGKQITLSKGGAFSILLSNIGINIVDDSSGTGTIHNAEPSQAVVIDTSNSKNATLLGTYKNHHKIKQELLDKILDKKLISGEIDSRYYTNVDYDIKKEFITKFRPIFDILKIDTSDNLQRLKSKINSETNTEKIEQTYIYEFKKLIVDCLYILNDLEERRNESDLNSDVAFLVEEIIEEIDDEGVELVYLFITEQKFELIKDLKSDDSNNQTAVKIILDNDENFKSYIQKEIKEFKQLYFF